MKQALALAEDGLGRVAPNPSVGCVIVKDGVIAGQGRTSDGGRPHAEVVALAQAGEAARGADVYVTLEPCAHQGKTPPCAKALVDAGAARVVIACHDPDDRVNGAGVAMLRDAGIEVVEGVCEDEARMLNRGFFLRVQQGRPLVTLKMAISADGKIAGVGGARVQISGAEAAAHMHSVIRAKHDAILVGRGTVLRDDPYLTTRVGGLDHAAQRVVWGRSIPDGTHLAAAGDVMLVQGDVRAVLEALTAHGVTRLLVEGGARVVKSFVESGLWDQLYLYRGAVEIGADGIDAPDFGESILQEELVLGGDRLEIHAPKA